jgi:prefoldin subunit 5|tara:strand:- start:1010 stop:1270 length:261 start_codon:yes stop_codon:yes gene_type:complete
METINKTMKLTVDELQSIKNLNEKRDILINQFGLLEFDIQSLELQKEELINTLQDITTLSTKLGVELQEKYGEGNVNIDTGEFIPR